MKKCIAVMFITITISVLLAGCGRSTDIGKDKAKEIALEDAKLKEADVTRLDVSKERDDGKDVYDVEFTSGNIEYEYEISASSGKILSSEQDGLHGSDLSNQKEQQEQKSTPESSDDGQTDKEETNEDGTNKNETNKDETDKDGTNKKETNKEKTASKDVKITLEEASKLALKRVSGASEKDLKIKLDKDDNPKKYEGEIIYKKKEYDFEIDANTGDFLKWEEERR